MAAVLANDYFIELVYLMEALQVLQPNHNQVCLKSKSIVPKEQGIHKECQVYTLPKVTATTVYTPLVPVNE